MLAHASAAMAFAFEKLPEAEDSHVPSLRTGQKKC